MMRCEFCVVGEFVHCRVYGPGLGKAGDLVISAAYWDFFRMLHPMWSFKEDE